MAEQVYSPTLGRSIPTPESIQETTTKPIVTEPVQKPVDPIAYEDQELPSAKQKTAYNKEQADYVRNLAAKLRSAHPELKDATDEETFGSVKDVELPDASPEEYWQVLGDMYGEKPKEPSMIQKAGAHLADIPATLWQDIVAIPKGIKEYIEGTQKLNTFDPQKQYKEILETGKSTPTPEQVEGEDIMKRANAHLIRGGAFGAGWAAGVLTAGAVNPLTSKISSTVLRSAVRGSVDAGIGLGTEKAIREAAKPSATPLDVWNAFQEGTTSGAILGGVLGGGGAAIGQSARRIFKGKKVDSTLPDKLELAKKVGELTVQAKTPAAAAKAAKGFSDIFQGEWAPPGADPNDFATGLIKEIYGEDVAASKAGMKAIEGIAIKVRELRNPVSKELSPNTVPAEITPVNVLEKSQEELLELAKTTTGSEKIAVIEELKNRPAGHSVQSEWNPLHSEAKPADPSKASHWTKYLKHLRSQSKSEPGNIELKDELFRAEKNFESWKSWKESHTLAKQEAARARLEVASKAEINKAIHNPAFKADIERLKNNGASDAEIENLLKHAMDETHGRPFSDLASEGDKVYAGFDPSLIRKLASKMYSSDAGRIIPKELVQNALDAVRTVPKGEISVNIKTIDRKILVHDNGAGMTPEVVKKELVDLGSSLKPENASGGFGLAKAALFSNAEEINIKTIATVGKDKIETTLIGSGTDWANPKKGLKLSSKKVNSDTPTGTTVELKLMKKDVDGNDFSFQGWQAEAFGEDLLTYNRTNIPVNYVINGRQVGPIIYEEKLIKTIELPEATIDITIGGPDKEYPFGPGVKILNNGIPQFNIGVFAQGPPLPTHIVANIKSKIKPDNSLYPFTTNREQITKNVEGAISNYIREELLRDAVLKERDMFKNIIMGSPKINIKSKLLRTDAEPVSWSVIDFTPGRDKKLIQEISQNPVYEPYLASVDNVFTQIQRILTIHDTKYADSKFWGLSTTRHHLAANVKGDLTTGAAYNYILVNPWNMLSEVLGRVDKKITGDHPKDIMKDLGDQHVSSLIHELVHQIVGPHNDQYSGVLTRVYGHLGSNFDKLAREIERTLDNDFLRTSAEHLKKLKADDQINTTESIFAKASTDLAGAGDATSYSGGSPFSQAGRIESQKTLSSRGGDNAKGIQPGSTGFGNLSSVIQHVREKFGIEKPKEAPAGREWHELPAERRRELLSPYPEALKGLQADIDKELLKRREAAKGLEEINPNAPTY